MRRQDRLHAAHLHVHLESDISTVDWLPLRVGEPPRDVGPS